MAVIRPFRALRPDPARASLGSLVCVDDVGREAVATALARDPRHLGRLLVVDASDVDAAEFGVVDLVRAGVIRRDGLPSLTVARVLSDGAERTLLYAALRADDALTPVASADATAEDAAVIDDADADAAGGFGDFSLRTPAVAVAPALVRFVDKKGRIGRAIEAETEREPDASFTLGGASVDVWIVDDESAAARISSLLEGSNLALVDRTRKAWAAYRAATNDPWALACFVDEEDSGDAVPAGLCLLPLWGPLYLPLSTDG